MTSYKHRSSATPWCISWLVLTFSAAAGCHLIFPFNVDPAGAQDADLGSLADAPEDRSSQEASSDLPVVADQGSTGTVSIDPTCGKGGYWTVAGTDGKDDKGTSVAFDNQGRFLVAETRAGHGQAAA